MNLDIAHDAESSSESEEEEDVIVQQQVSPEGVLELLSDEGFESEHEVPDNHVFAYGQMWRCVDIAVTKEYYTLNFDKKRGKWFKHVSLVGWEVKENPIDCRFPSHIEDVFWYRKTDLYFVKA